MLYKERAKQIFREEIAELEKVSERIGDEMDRAVDMIYECRGKVVVMGIGKTGIIGHKMAASLASTGTQAIFINVAEAMHGDLGMVSADDIVILVSNSGSTSEIIQAIHPIKNLGCRIIAMTGNPDSVLGQEAELVLNVGVDSEACPLGLAPTTSTTATLLMGDALLVCLMEKRQFKADDFALYHPGGALGRKLLERVHSRMTTDVPKVQVETPFWDMLYQVSDKRLGMTLVYDGEEAVGIITDGDIRRAVQNNEQGTIHLKAGDIMTKGFKTIHKNALLTDALALMDRYDITTLAVTEGKNECPPISASGILGIISIHHIIDFERRG